MINLETARAALAVAVATQGPEFVYNPGRPAVGEVYGSSQWDCHYEPQPDHVMPSKRVTGCLIGVALDLLGEHRQHGSEASPVGLKVQFPDMLTQRAASYFNNAQAAQDQGKSWGEALEQAEAALTNIRRAHKDS